MFKHLLILAATLPCPLAFAQTTANNDAMAALDAQDLKIVGGQTAPSVVPLLKTNFAIPAGAVFVSPDGSPARSGATPDAPTTVQNALKIVPVGGTIVFRGGSYRGLSALRLPRRVTLQAFPNEAP